MTNRSVNPNSGHRQRLRQRYRKSGLKGFHDYEVVELLLTYAVPRRDVKPIAKHLLSKFGGIRGLLDATIEELEAEKGIGENAAILLALIKETAGVYLKERMVAADVISSPRDVLDYLDITL